MGFIDKRVMAQKQGSMALVTWMLVPPAALMLLIVISSLVTGSGDTGFTAFSGIVFIFTIISMIIYNNWLKKTFENIKTIGRIAEEDHDGVITIKRLSEMTGMTEKSLRVNIPKWMKDKILINMRYDEASDTIFLAGATAGASSAHQTGGDYVVLFCATCGAPNTVPAGSAAKCKHCGSYLRRE